MGFNFKNLFRRTQSLQVTPNPDLEKKITLHMQKCKKILESIPAHPKARTEFNLCQSLLN